MTETGSTPQTTSECHARKRGNGARSPAADSFPPPSQQFHPANTQELKCLVHVRQLRHERCGTIAPASQKYPIGIQPQLVWITYLAPRSGGAAGTPLSSDSHKVRTPCQESEVEFQSLRFKLPHGGCQCTT